MCPGCGVWQRRAIWYHEMMKKVGIVGYGRFGALLAELARSSFAVHVVETAAEQREQAEANGHQLLPFEALGRMDIIFLAVPISELEGALVKLAPLVSEQHIVIDLCSVKVYPARLMQKYLPHTQLLATHPMFGPDSAAKGLTGLQLAVCPLTIKPESLQIVTDFWTAQGVEVLETTPEDHDRDAVYSLAFTHTVAKIILDMNMPAVTFRTRSFDDITEVAELCANDSPRLFHDMLFYNPYLTDMQQQLAGALQQTTAALEDIATEQSTSGLF